MGYESRRRSRYTKKNNQTKKKLYIYVAALILIIVLYFALNIIGKAERDIPVRESGSDLQFRKDRELTIYNRNGVEVVTLDIEIARDQNAIMQGLMYRESMEENQGMLFIFPNSPREISMWMKNTIMPLDMLFIRQNKSIAIIAEDTVPFDETFISSEEPVSYVLEVNAGFARKYGIEPGFRVDW